MHLFGHFLILLAVLMLALPYSWKKWNGFILSQSKILLTTRLLLTTNIAVVGKKNSVESWITEGINEYEKRLRPIMNLNTIFLKNNEDLIEYCDNTKGTIIALDEHGKMFTSKEFTEFYYKGLELGGATTTFVIGGFDGLPNVIRKRYTNISLSTMTWTHQMARLLLIEQIYRATEIRKGSGYHKE